MKIPSVYLSGGIDVSVNFAVLGVKFLRSNLVAIFHVLCFVLIKLKCFLSSILLSHYEGHKGIIFSLG